MRSHGAFLGNSDTQACSAAGVRVHAPRMTVSNSIKVLGVHRRMARKFIYIYHLSTSVIFLCVVRGCVCVRMCVFMRV